jgi:prevent-host-death family protein
VKRVLLSDIGDDLSRFLREAESEEIVITGDGKPAGLLIGFATEDDWLDEQIESDARRFAPHRARPRRPHRGYRMTGEGRNSAAHPPQPSRCGQWAGYRGKATVAGGSACTVPP